MGPAPTPGAVLTAYARILIKSKAKQLCRRSGFCRSDEDDLVSELTLRLLEKEHLYDAARGASMETFADRVINSAVKMILRDRRRMKRAAGFTALSLDRTTVIIDRKPIVLGDVVGDADRQRVTLNGPSALSDQDQELIREIANSLPPDLRDIANRILADGTIASVARDLDESRRQVYAALHRAMQHFEDAGFAGD